MDQVITPCSGTSRHRPPSKLTEAPTNPPNLTSPLPLRVQARTVAAFRQEPYGCGGELLAKRLRRDPFAVGPPHPSRCPDMRALLMHCSPYLFEGKLPWGGGVVG